MHRGLKPVLLATSENVAIGKEVRRLVVFIQSIYEIIQLRQSSSQTFNKIAVIW